MSWATYKALVEAELTSYREIPENKSPEETAMSHNHYSYSLNWEGLGDPQYFTNDKIAYYNIAKLEVKYKNMNSDERKTNSDAFIDLIKEITTVSGFAGFVGDATFSNIDNKHSKGTLIFYIGAETNCS